MHRLYPAVLECDWIMYVVCALGVRVGHISQWRPSYVLSSTMYPVAWSAQACVSGMFELKDDSAFKAHLRDFLVQTKSFADKNNADLFAEEAAAAREVPLLALLGCCPNMRSTRSCRMQQHAASPSDLWKQWHAAAVSLAAVPVAGQKGMPALSCMHTYPHRNLLHS